MKVIFSEKFKGEYKKIKDNGVRSRILKQIEKISDRVDVGKPLGGDFGGHRSLRVKPFRIIYRIEKKRVIVVCFGHRKRVYGK